MTTKNSEHLHEEVFGKSFSRYDAQEMEQFVSFFDKRFKSNSIDPSIIFRNKKCLDAGCGNGRGAMFMARHGAASIALLDISPTNIESSTKNLKSMGYSNFTSYLGSLENMPFLDQEFDFVWCNGVIMHTHNPDKCLQEISRVLKSLGQAWIYVYGSGGLYWYCMYRFRKILKNISPSQCISALDFIGYSARYVAEYLDDWKVPYLRTYTHKDFGGRMAELGFSEKGPLKYGVSYDTSERLQRYPHDDYLLGEGDLRYLVEKESLVKSSGSERTRLSDSEYGSDYEYDNKLLEIFNPLFDELEQALEEATEHEWIIKVAACAKIQYALRQLMAEDRPFPIMDFQSTIKNVISFIKSCK